LGIHHLHFEQMLSYLFGMRDSSNRSTRNALAMFLMLIRMDVPQEKIGQLFGVDQVCVSRTIEAVSIRLEEAFVPMHLGFHCLTKEEIITKHSTVMSRILTQSDPGTPIFIMDGTYFYIMKSQNFTFQKQTFSGQKHRNLVKAMVICCPDGHIIDIVGMYCSDGYNNDAGMTIDLYDNNSGFQQFAEGSVVVVDRGFRDAVALFESYGNQVVMPNLLTRGHKQFTWEEANESRLVTKIRWVVESVNGRIKNVFKFFRSTIQNTYIDNDKAARFLRIACAMLNAFHPALATNSPRDAELAQYIFDRSVQSNRLAESVMKENLRIRKAEWKLVNHWELIDFPRADNG
jgi:DDE superfamily endonuclease